MLKLKKYASLIDTDSGGVKKEALFRGVFSVTLRQETECVGILYSGCKRLDLPVDSLSMVRMIKVCLTKVSLLRLTAAEPLSSQSSVS